jgi:glutamate carboxypeptidase
VNSLLKHLDWLDSQQQRMLDRVIAWANINSYTHNVQGVNRVAELVRVAFQQLGAQCEWVDLPPVKSIDDRAQPVEKPIGRALLARKRVGAAGARRVFLGIHIDTVYPPDHAFRSCTRLDETTVRGPGVIDAKGGLVVMVAAIEALERSGLAEKVAWEVLINPDEEIGSPSSAPLLAECAKRNEIGLVYEPAFGDGLLVGPRKGSGTFTVVVRGKAAHAGRDFEQGRNAIVALADFLTHVHAINGTIPGVTLNVGNIRGGGPANVVPDLAVSSINIRTSTGADETRVRDRLESLLAELNTRDGIRADLHGGFSSPPKELDERSKRLLEQIIECGREIGLSKLTWTSSGGVSDGNKLAASGLPDVDAHGPR